jgi:hypothetical protein
VARAKLTTKNLAQRIDLEYFKHPHPFRRLRFILSVALPVTALLWLGWHALARNDRLYSGGRMSASHAVLTARCNACHVAQAGAFSARASDQGCDTCHDAPLHHANQIFTPTCAACHAEHRGHPRLAVTADVSCTQCHASLHTTGAATHFTSDITRFVGGHPEFAALRTGSVDPGTIKLNHAIHLKHNLRGPNGLVQLDCDDCHRTAKPESRWRFGSSDAHDPPVNLQAIPPSMDSSLRKTLRRLPRIAVRSAFPGRRAARYARGDPCIPAAKVSAIYSEPSCGPAREGSEPESSASADPACRARAHRAAVGGPARGGIGRAALAEDVHAMPRIKICSERAVARGREIEYYAAMVPACRVQSRYAQAFEMRRMPFRRADQPGNRRRLAAGDSDLREMPSRWARSGGVAMFRMPHLPRLETREEREGNVHVVGVTA